MIQKKQQIGIVVAIVALAIGAVTVGSSYATDSLEEEAKLAKISIDEAKKIAITHLNTQASNLDEIEIEKEGGSLIYEAEFEIDGQEVEVEIDSHTGKVLEVEYEALEEEDDDDEDEDEDDDDELEDDEDD